MQSFPWQFDLSDFITHTKATAFLTEPRTPYETNCPRPSSNPRVSVAKTCRSSPALPQLRSRSSPDWATRLPPPTQALNNSKQDLQKEHSAEPLNSFQSKVNTEMKSSGNFRSTNKVALRGKTFVNLHGLKKCTPFTFIPAAETSISSVCNGVDRKKCCVVVLCSLLLHGIAGVPLARAKARQALAKSAHGGDDLISGSDFLSVFIGATVPRPRSRDLTAEEPKLGDELDNSHHDVGNKVIDNIASYSSHLENDLDSIPNADEHTSFLPNAPEDAEPIGQEHLASNNSFPTLGIESAPSTFVVSSEEPPEEIPVNTTEESEATTTSTPEAEEDSEETHKVISVRVSSSVARQSNKDAFFDVKDEEDVSLVTEEQPAATAVQRSEFSVEEASPSSSVISVHHESSSSRGQSPPPAPVSYHTSVSTATSGSRVQFYREPPSYHRVSSSAAETVQRSVVANYGQPATVFQRNGPLQVAGNHQQPPSEESSSSRSQKSFEPALHQERNYEVSEQRYGTPERSYARPEQNYEVDESVSVMSNGRAHGVQTTPGQVEDTGLRDFSTQPGETRDPNSKFGYVVEGRNFRKYRVEERTSDGFIVGEYGVVSHDDGSLRGVRYTADGTINPRLIYDALVKFLSL
ncbi:hypothetical protein C0J52_19902 [Blattella germanica]|nr:hypothetical protein C0J52_19902 [Blattella germanica]